MLSDSKPPLLNAIEALEILKGSGLDLPFIIVSSDVNDRQATAALKAGVHDFIPVQNLSRLAVAVERELRHAAERREHRKTQASITSKIPVIEEGKVVRVITVLRDITEQKKLEAQFLRAQSMENIGTLASGIAHDLNNVLSPILMGAQVLRDRITDLSDQATLVAIETSAQRGADIVKQVLTFGRGIDGERISLQPKHIIKEMAKIAEETFPKSIDIKRDLPPDLWTVIGDPTQLHQVLLNLCMNARDAMPQGGALTLSARNIQFNEADARMNPGAKAGSYVVITVSDTGAGIPAEIIDKIFDPFFTTKAAGKGTGLGLSTTLGIVKSHGGFTQVHSEPDHGAQFEVFIPAQIGQTAAAEQTKQIPPPKGNNELILVVDDERPVREATTRILVQNGYRVLTAQDGAEAVALLALNLDDIKAVLTDMMMPIMDGISTARAINKINPRLPIISTTGMPVDPNDTNTARSILRAVLPKPFKADELLRTLYAVLSKQPQN